MTSPRESAPKSATAFQPLHMLIQDLVQRHVSEAPDRIAITSHGRHWTYGELASSSDLIASHLVSLGVQPGDRIGVFLERSFSLIAGLLGILKAHAAYVPLDLQYPPHRLEWMARDGGFPVFLTTSDLVPRFPDVRSRPILLDQLDCEEDRIPHSPSKPGFSDENEDRAAYVMYTSGSTGVPKGVIVPHRGIRRLVHSTTYIQIRPEDVFFQHSPVSFDASTFEIWGALTQGARLVLMPPGKSSLRDLGRTIQEEGVTVLWLTSGLFNSFIDEHPEALSGVKHLLAGGDILSVPHVARAIRRLPGTQLYNGYGPTENTTFSCVHRIEPDPTRTTPIPIGKAIDGTTTHVLKADMTPVNPGEEGELFVGGRGVALGYLNQPELTQERFLPDPFSRETGSLLYRTGDYVRALPDGTLAFLGRKDRQVKLRGFRIELDEVETHLRNNPWISDCAVTIQGDDAVSKQMIAWVVSAIHPAPSERSLREHFMPCMPAHMLPERWQVLERLPLDPNGKIDRTQLKLAAETHGNLLRPQRPVSLEDFLCGELGQMLSASKVPMDESFFELGANSLLITQLHARLEKYLAREFPITDLFQFTTARTLAHHLQNQVLS